MCRYCELESKLSSNGAGPNFTNAMYAVEGEGRYWELLEVFAGPNGKAMVKVYKIQKGLK